MKYIKAFLLVAFSVLAALCVFSACTKDDTKAFITLQTPENVKVGSDEILTWDKVAAADGYEVSVDDKIYQTEDNNFDICLLTVDPYTHNIQVRATSNDENVISSPFSGCGRK